MGLLSNLFNGKNRIDDKLEGINILKATMRQNEALNETKSLIYEIIGNPKLINSMKNFGELGNFLTNQLNNFNQSNE